MSTARHVVVSFCFYLIDYELKKLDKETTSGFNISTQNDSARISYRQQVKVQILTLLNSKGQYLSPVYFENLPQNENVAITDLTEVKP